MKDIRLILLALSSAFLLSLPWLGLAPGCVLLLALLPLFVLEDEIRKQRTGNPYLFFNYALLTFWLWHVLTVWWVVKITVAVILLLSLLNAASMALIWWLYHRMRERFNNPFAFLALLCFWLGFEYWHYHREIEWPWLNLGNGLASVPQMVQWYEFTGVLGGSLWILLSNMLLFSVLKKMRQPRIKAARSSVGAWFLLIVLPLSWSYFRYFSYRETGTEIQVAVIQPNIDPFTQKFEGMSQAEQYLHLVHLCDSAVSPGTDYILGPETCLPDLLENAWLADNSFIHPFRERSRRNGNLKYIFGAISRKDFPNKNTAPEFGRWDKQQNCWYELYNSAIQIDSDGIQIYHKSIRVAGVEKMPYEKYFSFIKKWSLDLGGTSGSLGRQTSPTPVTSEKAVVAPVICFESVFGEYLGQSVLKGADVLFILTNDGWLDHPSGYRQHFDLARLRAIETRRSIARAANTGISGFINQRGDILQQTEWHTSTAMTGSIRTNNGISFYSRFGDYIGRIAAFLGILLLLYFVAQRLATKQTFGVLERLKKKD